MSQPENVQWLAPIAVLVVGVIAGAIAFLRTRSAGSAPGVASGRNDMQLEFDAMITRLRELAAAGAAFDTERRLLERDAAVILRSLSEAPAHEPSTAPVVASGNRALRAMMWITGSSVALAILYVVLLQSTAPRQQDGVVTGAMPTGDTTLAALEQQLAAEPANDDARVELARRLLERGDMAGVLRETGTVLDRDPQHARALSYRALAVLAGGDSDTALALLNRALAKEPELVEGWIHLSLVHTQRGDRAGALSALKTARLRAPESAELIDTLEKEILARFGEKTPAAQSEAGYSLRIAGTAVPGAVIFVVIRPVGVTAGPPVAAKRLDASVLPLETVISAADSMTGAALPSRARIEARLDFDGDAATRESGAPVAVVDAATLGSVTELRLR